MEPIDQVGYSPVAETVPVPASECPVAAGATLLEDAVAASWLVYRSSAGPGDSGIALVLALEEAHSIPIVAAHTPNPASVSDSKPLPQPPEHWMLRP